MGKDLALPMDVVSEIKSFSETPPRQDRRELVKPMLPYLLV
jgi:hypothetical protein